MKPKKILFVHHGVGASGADISLLYLMQGLKKRGVSCVVGCVKDSSGAIPFYQSYGFKAVGCRAGFFPHTTGGWHPLWKYSGIRWITGWWLQYKSACKRISKLIKEEKPDIVHLNSPTLAPYLPVISSHRIPAVLHVRERVHPGNFGVRKRWLKKVILQYAGAVIYICKDNRDHLTGKHPIGCVIYNPVDFKLFDRNLVSDETRKRMGLTDGAKVVLFLGGSGLEIKGIMPLLKSLRILKQQIPDFKCIMLGTRTTPIQRFFPTLKRKCANFCGIYSLRQQIERSINKYAIEENVISLPFTRNIETFYAMADVVVVPFIEPHFARQVIEAGAMAKPVVASRIGGIEEVVVDGKSGALVAPGDADALSNGLARILENHETGRKMGEAAYLIAREKYALDVHVTQVCEIYESLISFKTEHTP